MDQPERLPLNGHQMPPPDTKLPFTDEKTQMLSPEDVRTPCDDVTSSTTNTKTKDTSNNSNSSSNNKGPAFVW